MARPKIVLQRQVTYGIPAEPEKDKTNRVIVNGITITDDPLGSENQVTSAFAAGLDLPTSGWGDDDVIAGIVKAYPACDVSWQPPTQIGT